MEYKDEVVHMIIKDGQVYNKTRNVFMSIYVLMRLHDIAIAMKNDDLVEFLEFASGDDFYGIPENE